MALLKLEPWKTERGLSRLGTGFTEHKLPTYKDGKERRGHGEKAER